MSNRVFSEIYYYKPRIMGTEQQQIYCLEISTVLVSVLNKRGKREPDTGGGGGDFYRAPALNFF